MLDKAGYENVLRWENRDIVVSPASLATTALIACLDASCGSRRTSDIGIESTGAIMVRPLIQPLWPRALMSCAEREANR